MTATAGKIEKPEPKWGQREGEKPVGEVTGSHIQAVPLIEAAITLGKHVLVLRRLPSNRSLRHRQRVCYGVGIRVLFRWSPLLNLETLNTLPPADTHFQGRAL